jgi:hypothetical protein
MRDTPASYKRSLMCLNALKYFPSKRYAFIYKKIHFVLYKSKYCNSTVDCTVEGVECVIEHLSKKGRL